MGKIPADHNRVTFCESCGREIQWRATRCRFCGEKRTPTSRPPSAAAAQTLRDAIAATPETRQPHDTQPAAVLTPGPVIACGVVGGLLLVVGGGLTGTPDGRMGGLILGGIGGALVAAWAQWWILKSAIATALLERDRRAGR